MKTSTLMTNAVGGTAVHGEREAGNNLVAVSAKPSITKDSIKPYAKPLESGPLFCLAVKYIKPVIKCPFPQ